MGKGASKVKTTVNASRGNSASNLNDENGHTHGHTTDEVGGKTKYNGQNAAEQNKASAGGRLASDFVTETNNTSDKVGNETDINRHLVVIAIDFGTVHSGFAYSFKGYENNITSATRGRKLEEDRVPTVVLLKKDDNGHMFQAFGFEAQRIYFDTDENERGNFLYMENFKMALYEKETISRDTEINDVTGTPIKAMKVFSLAIENLKKLALDIVLQTKIGLTETAIQWMITIPAISSDSARQFMREAARDAGIPGNQLRLVLEPEAAALCCQEQVLVEQKLPVGFKYVLADLGGGTSDICVHEVLDDNKLREVYRASGETSGGTDVDQQFILFMKQLVDKDVWADFKSNYPSSYIQFINDFQKKKRMFESNSQTITVKLEYALLYVIENKIQKTLEDLLEGSKFADKLTYKPNELRLLIQRDLIEQFFNHSINSICELLKNVLQACLCDVNTLLLVGGYSESPYLRERIQNEFSNTCMKVVLIEDARLAVLKGAVMMGWKPKNIIQRRSRFTYGFCVGRPFIEGEHPESLKHIQDGKALCIRIFVKMIEKGQIVEYGQTIIDKGYGTAKEPEEKHTARYTSLYRSTQEDPWYCTEEEECTVVGHIVCKHPPEGWPDYWRCETHLIVGETEFTVKYFNLTTGEEYEVQMDFL